MPGLGARVTVEVTNDCPTLTGARTTFSARLRVPRELEAAWRHADPGSDGRPDCGSGKRLGAYRGGSRGDPPWEGDLGRKGPRFVYVWSGLGRSWQVSGNATSTLVLDTRGVPLGSHPMVLVVYRRGGPRQFVPVARTTSQFTVTDQVPFSVELSQSGGVGARSGKEDEEEKEEEEEEGRQRFVAGPNVRFEARLHDPSGFLRGADVSFSWDFGDGSGLLISRLSYALHSYVGRGAYVARLAVQATVPAPCATTASAASEATTTTTTTTRTTVTTVTTAAAATSAASINTTTTTTIAASAAGNATITTAASVSTTDSASTAEQPGPTTVVEPYGTTVTRDSSAGNVTTVSANRTSSEPPRATDAAEPLQENPALSFLLLSRAQSAQDRPADCPLYLYGTYSTTVEVVDGIAVAQVRRAVAVAHGEALFSAPRALLDFEVESQGGSPTRVCSELLSADCVNSLEEAACEAVLPGRCGDRGPVCSLVLRREFHSSGSYCLRVTVADARSSASDTTRLSLQSISEPVSLEAAVICGALAVVLVLGLAVFMHRRPGEIAAAAAAAETRRGDASESRWPRRWWRRCRCLGGTTVRDLLANQGDPKHVLLING